MEIQFFSYAKLKSGNQQTTTTWPVGSVSVDGIIVSYAVCSV